MKAPKGMEDMAERIRAAATTPALTIAQPVEAMPSPPVTRAKSTAATQPIATKRVKGAGASASVFLRVPLDKYAKLEAEATKRTKATGKGVTVQQIILERI